MGAVIPIMIVTLPPPPDVQTNTPLNRERSLSCLPKVEQLADGRVRVREEEARELVVVRAGAALERHQLR